MINSGNTYINEIHYQGYTIKKVYACGGEFVWGEKTLKYKGEYLYGKVYELECDGNPQLTFSNVQPPNYTIGNLTAATIYPCAQYLDYEVFGAATKIKRAVMLEGVKSIGVGAFNRSSALTEVIIPDSVTSIGAHAFEECDKLSALTIGSGVTTIGIQAFSGCSSIDNDLSFPNIDRVNVGTFRGCIKLNSVTLGSGCTRIEENAFTDCSGLTSITVEATTPPTLVTNALTNTNNCTIYVPCESVDAYKTASGWSTYASRIVGFGCPLKWKATYSNSTVVTAECDSTTAITKNEITLTNLVDVEIGDCVTSINLSAFEDCRSLTNITISNSVTTIGSMILYNCTSLASVTIGSGITSIGSFAFANCSGLTSVTVEATTPPTITINIFNNTNNYTIYVPSGSVDAYKAASGWVNFASRIQAIP